MKTDLNNRLRRWINLSQIDWQRLPSDREWIFPNWEDERLQVLKEVRTFNRVQVAKFIIG